MAIHIKVNGVYYTSILAAARALNIKYGIVLDRVKSNDYPTWHAVEPEVKKIFIDGVEYASMKAVAEAFKVTIKFVARRFELSGFNGWRTEVNGMFVKPKSKNKPKTKYKTGSKQVSINGLTYPTISAACFYHTTGWRLSRQTALRRLNSTDPKWADWKIITEDEMLPDLPLYLKDAWFETSKQCAINEHNVLLVRYLRGVPEPHDRYVGPIVKVGMCFINDTPISRNYTTNPYQTMSFKLTNGKYLCVKGLNVPARGSEDFAEFKESVKKYLAYKQSNMTEECQ